MGAFVTLAILISVNTSVPRATPTGPTSARLVSHTPIQPSIDSVTGAGSRTVGKVPALSDHELAQVAVLELNLAVARGIPGFEDLDTVKYQRIVDGWANRIKAALPAGEMVFRQSPQRWQNDIRFFRLGQVAGYLDQEVGIVYIEEQKRVDEIRYTDTADLFIHGLVDTKQGTCGNMPTLHVAIGRRLGWPVSLAAVKSHTVCRYDDGQVVYNIEATHTDIGGMFSAGTDEDYLKEFNLPKRAVTSGSDLPSMTARQMLGYFIALRARHFADTGRMGLADRDYALARALLPNHRRTWQASMEAAVVKGAELFAANEPDGPVGLAHWLNGQFMSRQAVGINGIEDRIAEVERINAINRMRMDQHVPVPAHWGAGMPVNPHAHDLPNHTAQHQPINPYGPVGSP